MVKVRTDRGAEFCSRKSEAYFRRKGIEHFVTDNDVKAAVAERVIKTIRNGLFRYMNHKQTHQYLDVLPEIVKSYNQTPHSALHGVAPADVTEENEAEVMLKLYYPQTKKKKTTRVKKEVKKPKLRSVFKFKVGDAVRISHLRQAFTRTFHGTFTGEIFTIAARFYKQNIPIYKLKDYNGREISGTVYESELQRVIDPESLQYRIERVLKKRLRNRKKQLLVKWMGWPSDYNSWIDADAVSYIRYDMIWIFTSSRQATIACPVIRQTCLIASPPSLKLPCDLMNTHGVPVCARST
ncbi:uncharacterized protein LOC117341414 [Pecten maximus]|uniref:uncharacterized protein LOC117341414 n=1 Tax=Pecten maximus TaxID=6579 RepID=UPI001458434D|nr:uncharacterized protein LOC117341414 [Pecten maximus]